MGESRMCTHTAMAFKEGTREGAVEGRHVSDGLRLLEMQDCGHIILESKLRRGPQNTEKREKDDAEFQPRALWTRNMLCPIPPLRVCAPQSVVLTFHHTVVPPFPALYPTPAEPRHAITFESHHGSSPVIMASGASSVIPSALRLLLVSCL